MTLGVQSPFGYAGGLGYQTDADSGLMRVGYRYYDPSTGRFISRDPIKDGHNWYTYCDNDPANNVDPYGLNSVKIGGVTYTWPGDAPAVVNKDGSVTIPGVGKFYPRPDGGITIIPLPPGGGGKSGGSGDDGSVLPPWWAPDLPNYPADRYYRGIPASARKK